MRAGPNGLEDFALAGENRQFIKAQAKIEGETIVVCSELVVAPVAVRYAFTNMAEASLFNTDGLPASSFRTNDGIY